MNDRFKFRIFIKNESNPKYNGMFKVHSLHLGTNKVIISSQHGNVSVNLDSNKILMQSTGLKDKNGKLIYEGDIVNMQHWRTPQEIIYINGVYCGWYMKQTKKEKGCTGKDCLSFSSEHIGKAEVIGNIYENKELLESEG